MRKLLITLFVLITFVETSVAAKPRNLAKAKGGKGGQGAGDGLAGSAAAQGGRNAGGTGLVNGRYMTGQLRVRCMTCLGIFYGFFLIPYFIATCGKEKVEKVDKEEDAIDQMKAREIFENNIRFGLSNLPDPMLRDSDYAAVQSNSGSNDDIMSVGTKKSGESNDDLL